MNNGFGSLLDRLITETAGSYEGESAWSLEYAAGMFGQFMESSLGHFSPELALCATIVCLLLVRLFGCDKCCQPYWVALFGSLVSFGLAYYQFTDLQQTSQSEEFFTGLLIYDPFTVFFRLFLLLFLILITALTVLSGIPDDEDAPDFYCLLLGSTIGMMLMASANHMLVIFLGVEMTSVPSYVMVGFLKGRRQSSEAALKYVVYGAGAAGVMLYGTSLVAGVLGTASLPEMASRMALLVGEAGTMSDPIVRTVILGIMLVMVGLAFKLSLVPFHFWCPDAFEGASAEVAGFLSVASKAGAFALLVRFCLAFAGNPEGTGTLKEIYLYLGLGLGVIAAASATFGNLAAYSQTNVKRLLAYSTIAHAGYMLMAVSAMMVILNAPAGSLHDPLVDANRCLEGLLYYLFVYLFMNLGAFAVVALIRNQIYSEEVSDYAGLGYQAPVLCVCMGICMFSLVGIPPMGGFFAKLVIFASVFKAGQVHWLMYLILIIGGLNTVFSLVYYVRVLKTMFVDPRPADARRADVPFNSVPGLYAVMVTVPVLVLGIAVKGLSETANQVASVLFR